MNTYKGEWTLSRKYNSGDIIVSETHKFDQFGNTINNIIHRYHGLLHKIKLLRLMQTWRDKHIIDTEYANYICRYSAVSTEPPYNDTLNWETIKYNDEVEQPTDIRSTT